MAPRKIKKTASKSVAVAPTGPTATGGPIEIVFSFDTTSSMAGCIAEVRTKVQEVIERLFSEIPGLHIAVFAHGDYCDSHKYVTKWADFSNDQKNLCDFVKNVTSTSGGDWEECYELVLRQVREELSWSPGTQRSLVMIGDAIPHPKNDKQNTKKIDWKEEVTKLSRDMGVCIYSIQCQDNGLASSFWKEMADMSGGRHVKLDQFQTIIDMIMSICYRETGPDFFLAYEKEVRAREGDKMRAELNLMFDALRDSTTAGTSGTASTATSAEPAKLSKKPSLKRKNTVPIADLFGVDAGKPKAGKVIKPKKTTLAKRTITIKTAAKLVATAKKIRLSSIRSVETGGMKREKIPTSRFFPELKWTKWYPAFQSNEPSTAADKWSERNGDHPGYRQHNLFYHNTKCPGMYEFAVQPKQGCIRYPVWNTVTKGFNSVYWDTYLARNERIQKQMDDVITKGSKLFVRRTVLKTPVKLSVLKPSIKDRENRENYNINSVDELRKVISETYDYAWSVAGKKTAHREVQKAGILISEEKFTRNRKV